MTPATVPMISPDGQSGDIPHDRAPEAIAAGFKPAIVMTSPDGQLGYIPHERATDALKAGFKIGQPAVQGMGGKGFDEQHPITAGVLNGLDSFGRGVLQGANAVPATIDLISDAIDHPENHRTVHDAKGIQAKAKAILDLNNPLPPDQGQGIVNRTLQGAGAIAGGVVTADVIPGAEDVAAAKSITKSVVDVPARAIESVKGATKTIASKVLPSLIDGPPEELMTRAVKPRNKNSGWDPAVKSAMPNLKLAEQELGKPVEGLDDALQATTLAKKNIWQQYEERLGSNARAQIDGNKVADAMMRSIDRRTATQNPQLAERVATVADTYRRPMTLAEAEEFLQSANNDLHNYYAKNKVGQRVALGDPEKAYTVAEADSLRSELYSRLDDLTGPGAAELKKQYGALSNIEEEMLNRKNVAARQNPQSLSEQLSIARGYGKIAKGVVTFSPGDIAEGAETVGSAKYLKERNSTDAMIQRAFAAYKTPSGPSVPPPVAPNIAGLLPSGPAFTPPPADISGTTPAGYRPPPVDATTRAVRKGLLLPDKTATPLPEWIGDSPGKVLNAKSVVVRDAKTGKMRRMYVTSGQ